MRATGLGDGAEAGQAIRQDGTSRRELVLGPLGDCSEGKAWHRGELDAQRESVAVSETAATKGTLFSAPDFAATALPAQVGIVNLNLTIEDIALRAQPWFASVCGE